MTYTELENKMVEEGFSAGFAAWWVANQKKYAADNKRTEEVCERINNNYENLKAQHPELYQK